MGMTLMPLSARSVRPCRREGGAILPMRGRTSVEQHTLWPVSNPSDDMAREWAFISQEMDPVVRDVLTLDDPWEAYRRAN